MSDHIPPFPSVTLGRGRWLAIIRILRARGTKEATELASSLERYIRHD